MWAEIHVGDVVDFEHIMRDDTNGLVDLSALVTATLHLIKPDGTVISKSGSLVSDGLDAKVHYVCLSTDLDVQGDWGRQMYVKTSSGEWTGKLFWFTVHRKLG